MKRPSVPAMDEMDAIYDEMEHLERTIVLLSERARDLLVDLRTQAATPEDLTDVVRYVYWTFLDIPSEHIASVLLNSTTYEVMRRIGPNLSSITCRRCNKPLEIASRTKLKQLQGKGRVYHLLCKPCEKEEQEECNAEYDAQRAKNDAHRKYLNTMPYREYLQTNEWQARRKMHLRSAGYRCQVCNNKDTLLDVHHRTYERRGHEFFKDLLALCRDCHELFHREGRLAQQ